MLQPKPKILIVDDNATDRLVIRGILNKLSLKDVQEAENGSVAVAKVMTAVQVNNPFDLVIVDWNMPQANGLKVLQQISREIRGVKPKVIVITGTADPNTVADAIRNGASDFIVKPVALETIREKLEKLRLINDDLEKAIQARLPKSES